MGEMVVGQEALAQFLSGTTLGLDPARAGDAGRRSGAGWPFFERGLGLAREPQPQHVHADRAGDRRGLSCYSLVATLVPGLFPASFRDAHGGRSRSTSRPRRSSRRSSCSARCSSCGPGARPRAPSRRCSASPPRRPGGSTTTAARKTSRSTRSGVGDRLRVRPGEKVPVDGVVLEGRSAVDESMVTRRADPGREGGRRIGCIGGTVNGTGGLVMRAERVGSETMLAQIVQHGRRGPAHPGADPAAGRRGLGLLRPGVWSRSRSSRSSSGRLFGPEPRLALRPGQRGGGPDHRLPVRPRAGHADVDHGRHRPRGARRAC